LSGEQREGGGAEREVAELYRRFGPLVLRRCRRLLGSDEEAEDALQEIFLKVLRSYASFRGSSSPSTWLYRVATNHCLNRLRDRGRAERVDQEVARRIEQSAEGAIAAREVLERLLARTDERTKAILVYRYLDDMSLQEVADTMGLARNTVASSLRKLERRLRRLTA
jgi:RNA polymerase sigma-70 factor, ECF subfamily